MKPREKVVSAQDVQSSLYYCHLASEDDDALLQTNSQEHIITDPEMDNLNVSNTKNNQAEGTEQVGDRFSHRSSILPTSTDTLVYKSSLQNEHQIRRKPVVRQNSQDQPTTPQHQTRKILGPRPLVHRSALSSSDILKSKVEPGSSGSAAPEQAVHSTPAPQGLTGFPTSPERLSSHSNRVLASSKHITLIRRDPATEEQWNIGNLSSSVPRSLQSRNPNAPWRNKNILISLSATGYTKFANQQDGTLIAVFEREVALSAVSDTKNGLQLGSAPASAGHPSHSFLTPWQTPCAFQTTATGRALKCYHSLPESLVRPSVKPRYGNGPQTALVSELRFNLPTLFEKSTAKKKENRRPVSFQPYGSGRQDILGGGRSISPDRSAVTVGNGQRVAVGAMQHSEQSSPTLDSLSHYRARSAELTSSFHAHLENGAENSEDEADTQLDLLLGQERAGGGFSGNKAKLGKLIVYGGQGLAMLDLLVAANMAIWFRDILEE